MKGAWRGKGIGKALLRQVASIAAKNGYFKIEWTVANWNRSAIDFYLSQGAEVVHEWTKCQIAGNAIRRLAAKPD